jgi:broad specificity phosphatase PhoE
MAELAAKSLKDSGVKIGAIYTSPLLRTQESAAHIENLFGLDAKTDERLIEPYNIFEGRKLSARTIARHPKLAYHLRNPRTPSWGEPYVDVVSRIVEAMTELAKKTEGGDVVLVTHQLPIWMTHRHAAGLKLSHNPSKRRCALSSITTFEVTGDGLVEVDYQDPAAELTRIDKGAV